MPWRGWEPDRTEMNNQLGEHRSQQWKGYAATDVRGSTVHRGFQTQNALEPKLRGVGRFKGLKKC